MGATQETTASTKPWFKRVSLITWIFIALILGVVAGLLMQGNADFATTYIKPIGTIFLNLIKMIVVPLVLFSIMAGIISMRDIKRIGAIGGKTVVFYLVTTAFAITLGLIGANVFNVAGGYVLPAEDLVYEGTTSASFVDTIVNIFPSNFFQPMADANMLQCIVVALFFGFGIVLAGEKAEPVAKIVDSLSEVCIKVVGIILAFAPFGVFGLICPVVASNGPDVLLPLLRLIVIAYAVMIVHTLVVYSGLIALIGKSSPVKFMKGQFEAFMMAFASASSVGTLPVNIKCSRKMGVSDEVSSFVLPLGATLNMDGTAIYQGVCAVFIAQVFGIDLTLGQQVSIVLTAVLASIGTAGVPGSGMIMLAMVLQTAGLPVEGIVLVAGVDRILDMMRTAVNVTGDGAVAFCIDAMEKRKTARMKEKALAE